MRANSLLLRTQRGWAKVDETDGNPLIIEGLIGHGTQPSEQESQRVGFARLATYAQEQQQKTIGIEPQSLADSPLHAYTVGDTVELDGEPIEVVSITGSRNDDGRVIWIPQLGSAFKTPEEQTSNAVKKMSEGTFRGDADEATPLDMISRKGNMAEPSRDPGTAFFRSEADFHVVSRGTSRLVWPDNFLVLGSNCTVRENTGFVEVPAGTWQVSTILRAALAGFNPNGYLNVYMLSYTAGGAIYFSSSEHRATWGSFDSGSTSALSATATSILPVPDGGAVSLQVGNFNAALGSEVEYEFSGHWIGPQTADFPA